MINPILKLRQVSSLKMAEAATEVDKAAALATAANEARGLAMDSIAAAHSGHMGLPLGCAEIGSVLYGSQVSVMLLYGIEDPLRQRDVSQPPARF